MKQPRQRQLFVILVMNLFKLIKLKWGALTGAGRRWGGPRGNTTRRPQAPPLRTPAPACPRQGRPSTTTDQSPPRPLLEPLPGSSWCHCHTAGQRTSPEGHPHSSQGLDAQLRHLFRQGITTAPPWDHWWLLRPAVHAYQPRSCRNSRWSQNEKNLECPFWNVRAAGAES